MANGKMYSRLSDYGFFPSHKSQRQSWLNFLSAVITSDLITELRRSDWPVEL